MSEIWKTIAREAVIEIEIETATETETETDEGVVLAIVIVDVALTAAIVIVVAITGLDPGRDLGIAIADQKVGKLAADVVGLVLGNDDLTARASRDTLMTGVTTKIVWREVEEEGRKRSIRIMRLGPTAGARRLAEMASLNENLLAFLVVAKLY